MVEVQLTDEFEAWIDGLRDRKTTLRLRRRLEKVAGGNFGDVAPVGEGVMEMREHFGPGWRMYYFQRGQTVVVMLGGGDKSSQSRDIAAAKQIAEEFED
jgi:putative addiction module killer protein